MKAIVKSRPSEGQDWPEGLTLEELPTPDLAHPDEVKIRVVAAGICGSDVGIYKSKHAFRDAMLGARTNPVILGHEFCGQIVDAAQSARVRLAGMIAHHALQDDTVDAFVEGRSAYELAEDRRFVEFIEEHFYCSAEMHITCGWCYQCRLGDRHHCQNTIIKGLHEHGAFAEYVVISASNVVVFRKGEIPVEAIAFMDALGNAVHTVGEVDLAGKSVAILGAGVQGLMATALARRSGASNIYVTDFTPPGSERGPEHVERTLFSLALRFGADHCFDLGLAGARERFKSVVAEETNGTGVDAVLEMSGNYGAYRDGLDIIRMGGTMALLGMPEDKIEMNFANDVIFRGVTLKGIIGRRVFRTWETMRNLLRAGLADELLAGGFVTHELPLDEFETGITAIMRRDAIKVLLKP